MEARDYFATETLRDGRRAEIRAIKPNDRAGMLAAVGRTGEHSLYRRFFIIKRSFTEREIDYFVDVDFVTHVALVVLVNDGAGDEIVGGGRYIVVQPGQAELAFAVDDSHQALGIATAVMRHLAAIARQAGLRAFVAEVLPENAAMLHVFEKSGLEITTRKERGTIHVLLRLASEEAA